MDLHEGIVEASPVAEPGFFCQCFERESGCVKGVGTNEMCDPVFIDPIVEITLKYKIDEIRAMMLGNVDGNRKLLHSKGLLQEWFFSFHIFMGNLLPLVDLFGRCRLLPLSVAVRDGFLFK